MSTGAKIVISGNVLKPRGTDVATKRGKWKRVLRAGQKNWQQRFLWLEQAGPDVWLCFSESPSTTDRPSKRFHVREIAGVSALRPADALKEGLQVRFLDKCIRVFSESKSYVFALLNNDRERWLEVMMKYGVAVTQGKEGEASDDDESEGSSGTETESDEESDEDDDASAAGSAGDVADAMNRADSDYDDDDEYEEDEEASEYDENSEDYEEADEDYTEAGSDFSPSSIRSESTSSPLSPGHSQAVLETNLEKSLFIDERKAASMASVERSTIRFAAKVSKCSSKGKEQDRYIVLTSSDFHIITDTRIRCVKTKIGLQQLRGVIRNNDDELQVAVLWPSGHDYLLSFLPTDHDAVNQFVAHLRQAHYQKTRAPNFIDRESNNILAVIRRTKDESYEPLTSDRFDEFRVASDDRTCQILRENGDATVHISQIVLKESKGGESSEKLLVVTDLAVYYFPPSDFSNLNRRIDLKNVSGVMHEREDGLILLQVSENEGYGKKSGDLLFSPLTHSQHDESLYHVFLEQFPKIVAAGRSAHDAPLHVAAARSKKKILETARLERRDAVAKTVGNAMKLTGNITKHGLRFTGRVRKLGGRMRGNLVQGVVKGMATQLYDAVGDMVGFTAGAGLEKETALAAEQIGLPVDRLTGPGGNSVFSLAPEEAVAEIENDARLKKKEKISATLLSAYVRANARFQEEKDLPEGEVPCFACRYVDALNTAQYRVPDRIAVITNRYLVLYFDPDPHVYKPSLSRKKREAQLRLETLTCVAECAQRPENFVLMFQKRDLFMSVRSSEDRAQFKAYLHCKFARVHERKKKSDALKPALKLQYRTVERPDNLRLLLRKPGSEAVLPALTIPSRDDRVKLSRCESCLRVFHAYRDTSVFFSAVCEAQLYKGMDKEAVEFDLKKYFCVVTQNALYLMRGIGDRLAIRKRIELPAIAGLLVNSNDNSQLVARVMYLTFTVTRKPQEDGQPLDPTASDATPSTSSLAPPAALFKKVPSKQGTCNWLETVFGLQDILDVTEVTAHRVVFRLWPVSEFDVMLVRKKMPKNMATLERNAQFYPYFEPAPLELEESLDFDDVVLTFPSGATDFVDQLSRARYDWSTHACVTAAPVTPEAAVKPQAIGAFTVTYQAPPAQPAGSGKKNGTKSNPMVACVRCKNPEKHTDPPSADEAVDGVCRWFERRLAAAVANDGDDSVARLQHVLEQGLRLGLLKPDDEREMVRAARRRVDDAKHRAQRLDRLKELIAEERFREFDRLISKGASAFQVEPEFFPHRNKDFRQVLQWSRKAGQAGVTPGFFDSAAVPPRTMTISDAKTFCLRNPQTIGFSHEGPPDITEEIPITFRVSDSPLDPAVLSQKRSKVPLAFMDKKRVDPTNAVGLGLVPNPSALVDVLYHTAWLKEVDPVTRVMQQKKEALSQKAVLKSIAQKIATVVGVDTPRANVDEFAVLVNNAQKSMTQPAALNYLADLQLLVSACAQRASIEHVLATDDFASAREPDFTRLVHLAWETLGKDAIDQERAMMLAEISYTACELHTVLADLDTAMDPHQTGELEQRFEALMLDFEEFAEENDISDHYDLMERAVKYRWVHRLSYRKDRSTAATVELPQPLALAGQKIKKKIEFCVLENDRAGLHEILKDPRLSKAAGSAKRSGSAASDDEERENGGLHDTLRSGASLPLSVGMELEEEVRLAEKEILSAHDRGLLVSKVANTVSAAGRLCFAGAGRATSEGELVSTKQSLEELLPQVAEYRSLAGESRQISFLLDRVTRRLQSVVLEKERDDAAERKRAEQESRNRERGEKIQERLDAKEVRRRRKEELSAQKGLERAQKLAEARAKATAAADKHRGSAAEFAAAQSALAKNRNECHTALQDARALAHSNDHPDLVKAVSLLEETLAAWDEFLKDKDEQEREAIAKDVDELIESRDKEKYLTFLKATVERLPEEEIVRIRLAWSALLSSLSEEQDALAVVEDLLKERDGHGLVKAISDPALKHTPADHPLMTRAKALIEELCASPLSAYASPIHKEALSPSQNPSLGGGNKGGGPGNPGAESEFATAEGRGDAPAEDESMYVDKYAASNPASPPHVLSATPSSATGTSLNASPSARVPVMSSGMAMSLVSNMLPGENGGAALSAIGSRNTSQTDPDPKAGATDSDVGGGGDSGDKPVSKLQSGLDPPPSTSDDSFPLLIDLFNSVRGLKDSSEMEPTGIVRCRLNNPGLPGFVAAWSAVLRYKTQKHGTFGRKKDRTELDVLSEMAKHVWSVNDAMDNFKVAKKLNTPKIDLHIFLLQYLLQCGRFFQVILDLLTSAEQLKGLYKKDAIFLNPPCVKYVIGVVTASKNLRFNFKHQLSPKDILYLQAIDAQLEEAHNKEVAKANGGEPGTGTGTGAAEEAGSPAEAGNGQPAQAPPGDAKETEEKDDAGGAAADGGDAKAAGLSPPEALPAAASPPAANGGVAEPPEKKPESAATSVMALLLESAAFDSAGEVGKLKIAVQQLLAYVDALRTEKKLRKGPKLKNVFDETQNHVLGVIVRERISPAIVALLAHGFKESGGALSRKKRHVWQYIETAAAAKKKAAQDLGALKLPEGIECVKNVVSKKLSRESSGHSGQSVNDIKLRALISYALNQAHLKIYVETLYNISADGKDALHKDWYQPTAALLDPKIRGEVDGVIELLDALNFHVLLDADVW